MNGDLGAFNRAMLGVVDDTSDVAEDRGAREPWSEQNNQDANEQVAELHEALRKATVKARTLLGACPDGAGERRLSPYLPILSTGVFPEAVRVEWRSPREASGIPRPRNGRGRAKRD